MSTSDPREQALQQAHEILSEQFPHVAIAAEAQFVNDEGQPAFAQLMRWYGDSTTATGLLVYASDAITRRFGEPKQPPQPAPPLPAPQEEALQKAMQILGQTFQITLVVAQSEGEWAGNAERSIKAIRCHGTNTMLAGLSEFASNALRRMAVGA
jgi:hypothetical protein